MLQKIIDTIRGPSINKANWAFELPTNASTALVRYHDTKMRHRVEATAADEVYQKARQRMHEDCKSLGKSYAGEFPKDHPIQITWGKASAVRDKLRQAHNSEIKSAHAALSESESEEYDRLWKDWCYSDANGKDPKEHMSPSGMFRLVITSHETSPGCWSYTKGKVYHHNAWTPIAEIRRNYSSFPFLWMEEHVDNYDYLICGEDYQGQTFVQLNTGKVVSNKSFGAEKGFGFCWSSYRLLGDGKTLLVDGCYWACPYEMKFFDVSNPMAGWPERELPADIDYLDPEKSEITVGEDDTILWEERTYMYKATGERHQEIDHAHSRLLSAAHKAKHQHAASDIIAAAEAEAEAYWQKYNMDDEPEDDPENWERITDRRIKLGVEDGQFVILEDWKSDWQLEQERRQEEYRAADLLRRKTWQEDDALLQHLAASQKNLQTGFMYPSAVNRWDGDKNPVYFRVSVRPDAESADSTATLQWGVVEGPVVVELWVRGKGTVKKPEFPRSVTGIQAAWDAAQTHIQGGA